MTVEKSKEFLEFLNSPMDFRLKIEGAEYIIDKALVEPGDNPEFTSYLLKPVENPPENPSTSQGLPPQATKPPYVVKLTNPDKVMHRLAVRSGRHLDFIDELRRIENKIDQAKALQRLATGSVPKIENYTKDREASKLYKDIRFLKPGGVDSELDISKHIVLREYIKGTILSKWMKRYEAQYNTGKSFQGIRETETWFQLARKIVDSLIPIHNERRVHGDLRPRNIILENMPDNASGKQLIDFERIKIRFLDTEEDAPSWFPNCPLEGEDGNHWTINNMGVFRRRYDSPQRLFEKKDEKGDFWARESYSQWFAPTDVFSLGVILFVLACGENVRDEENDSSDKDVHIGPFRSESVVWRSANRKSTGPTWFQVEGFEATKSNRQLKDSLRAAWKSRIHKFEKCDDDIRPTRTKDIEDIIRMGEVILACMRSYTDASMADLKSIQTVLDEFEPGAETYRSVGGTSERPQIGSTEELRGAIHNFFMERQHQTPELIQKLLLHRADKYLNSLRDFEIGGHWSFSAYARPRIVDLMVCLIRDLRPDDECQALITSNFFKRENMGLAGRLTSALQLAALAKKNKISWVIVVNQNQINGREVGELLQAQRAAAIYVNGFEGVEYGVKYVVVSDPAYTEILQDRLNSIRVVSNGKRILVAPDYHGEYGRISALRIWSSPDDERWLELNRAFKNWEEASLKLTSFQR